MSPTADTPGTTAARDLAAMALDARERTLEIVSDLDDRQMMGPQLRIVNPPLWELGHVAWFQELWNLRFVGEHDLRPSLLDNADSLYNSSEVEHDTRWTLPLISRQETFDYMRRVIDGVLAKLDREPSSADAAYFLRYATFHEDMHVEAFTYTRQTHGLKAPPVALLDPSALDGQPSGPLDGDVEIPGRELALGATRDAPFVFDNEKWAHPVEVDSFAIARAPVTNAQFLAFVEDGGYARRELWSEEGWDWRTEERAEHPVYWLPGGEWRRRHFDRIEPLEPHAPVVHVCRHEAEAYCRFAGRRLPSEAEWELAASGEPGDLAAKRRYPWGDEAPARAHANLDFRVMDTVDVAAFPGGDSAFGCRQMIGNVWEHCADPFGPYPGFERDPYEDYSEPWFGAGYGTLRGGSWAARGRMLRSTWRNFALPHRRDLFAGFRTCAA